jgi:hypothetical protein
MLHRECVRDNVCMRHITDPIRLGRQIVRVEAPRVRLRIVPGDRSQWYAPRRCIRWAPAGGLTALFHEIAHAQLGHKVGVYTPIQLHDMERSTWMRAERLAHKWGIGFDYALAEYYLMTYRPSVALLVSGLQPEWRHDA